MNSALIESLAEDPEALQQLERVGVTLDPAQLHEIADIAKRGDDLYETSEIPKRNGKMRTIHKPHPTLKEVQQELCRLFEQFPVFRPLYGFKRGMGAVRGVRDLLDIYRSKLGEHWIQASLQLDIENFFPNIRIESVQAAVHRCMQQALGSTGDLYVHVEKAIVDLCTYRQTVPQGASTSPILSNLAPRRMDLDLWDIARENDAVWGRYADDIVFLSRKKISTSTREAIETTIRSHRFTVAEGKTKYGEGKKQYSLWGVNILPPDGSIDEDPMRFRMHKKKEDELHARICTLGEALAASNECSNEQKHELHSIQGHLANATHIGVWGRDKTGETTFLRPRLEHSWKQLLATAQKYLPESAPQWYRKMSYEDLVGGNHSA